MHVFPAVEITNRGIFTCKKTQKDIDKIMFNMSK